MWRKKCHLIHPPSHLLLFYAEVAVGGEQLLCSCWSSSSTTYSYLPDHQEMRLLRRRGRRSSPLLRKTSSAINNYHRLLTSTSCYYLLIFLLLISSTTLLHNSAVVVNASSLKDKQHLAAIAELKRLVPPPTKHELGGGGGGGSEADVIDDAYYARFLSVNEWDPIKTESSIRQSIVWRKRVKPSALRPRHCPTLCRQYAWLALTTGPGSKMILKDDDEDNNQQDDTKNNDNKRSNNKRQPPLDPPYNCPPFQSWRTTKHGLPITYFRCWKWKPHLATSDESEKHLAYHIHHLIRRMPSSSSRVGSNNVVSRICVIFDLRGFETWMLPYVHKCINILRQQYPGRAGAMCFINVPIYFSTVWRVISPWLDDEIRSKVFFAPSSVNDVELAIGYLNKMKLKTGLL